jgi:hypothetical protein
VHEPWLHVAQKVATLKSRYLLGVVVYSCNPSTWEAKAEGSQVPAQELGSETQLKKKRYLSKKTLKTT